jgi:hypothetical protein
MSAGNRIAALANFPLLSGACAIFLLFVFGGFGWPFDFNIFHDMETIKYHPAPFTLASLISKAGLLWLGIIFLSAIAASPHAQAGYNSWGGANTVYDRNFTDDWITFHPVPNAEYQANIEIAPVPQWGGGPTVYECFGWVDIPDIVNINTSNNNGAAPYIYLSVSVTQATGQSPMLLVSINILNTYGCSVSVTAASGVTVTSEQQFTSGRRYTLLLPLQDFQMQWGGYLWAWEQWQNPPASQAPVSSGDQAIPVMQPFTPAYYGGSGTGSFQYYIEGKTSWGTAPWTPAWGETGTYSFYIRKNGDSNYATAVAGPYALIVGIDPDWELFDKADDVDDDGVEDWYKVHDWSPDPSTVPLGVEFTQTQLWRQNRHTGIRCVASGPSSGQEIVFESYTIDDPKTKQATGTGTNFSITNESNILGPVAPGSTVTIRARVKFDDVAVPGISVTFAIFSGGGGNFVVNGSSVSSPVNVTTGSDGFASIQYKQPDEMDAETSITASAGTATIYISTKTSIPAPANLAASASYGYAFISWSHVPGSWQEYEIGRASDAWPYSYVPLAGGLWASSYTDDTSAIADGTLLTYRVRARTLGGKYSAWADVTVWAVNW